MPWIIIVFVAFATALAAALSTLMKRHTYTWFAVFDVLLTFGLTTVFMTFFTRPVVSDAEAMSVGLGVAAALGLSLVLARWLRGRWRPGEGRRPAGPSGGRLAERL
jgi:hypothetical protein